MWRLSHHLTLIMSDVMAFPMQNVETLARGSAPLGLEQ